MNSWITNYFQGFIALREYLREITPDIDMSFQFVSELTGDVHDMDIPLNVEFFLPEDRPIHDQIFSLCFHGKGGFNHTEVYEINLSPLLYQIQEQFYKEEKKQMDKAQEEKGWNISTKNHKTLIFP